MDTKKDTVQKTVNASTPSQGTPKVVPQSGKMPSSTLTDNTVFDVSRAGDEGTIVSDRRSRHVPLTTTLKSAFTEWLGKTKEQAQILEEKLAPQEEDHTKEVQVAPAATRKEVLARAATHVHIAPKDDSETVIQNIRTYKTDVLRAKGEPIITAPKPSENGWKHTIEPVPQEKKKEVYEIPKKAEVAQIIEKAEVPVPQPPQEVVKEVPKEASLPESETSIPETPAFRSTPVPQTVKREIDELRSKETPRVSQKVESGKKVQFHISKIYIIRGVVAILVTLLGILFALFAQNLIQNKANTPNTVPSELVLPVSTFDETKEVSVIEIGSSQEEFRRAFIEYLGNAPQGITELHVQITENDVPRIITSREFFNALGIDMPQGIERSLTSKLLIGSAGDGREPYLIISAGNFDTLFSSMLEWESTLPLDLSPVFGTRATGMFIDAVRANTHVRILSTEDGNEIILYAIVDSNTLIVTTSSEALETILSGF